MKCIAHGQRNRLTAASASWESQKKNGATFRLGKIFYAEIIETCALRFMNLIAKFHVLLVFFQLSYLLAQSQVGTDASALFLTSPVSTSSLSKPVKLTVSITPPSASGKVAILEGTRLAATAVIGSNGQASVNYVPLSPGRKSLKAVYLGNSAFAQSESNIFGLNITSSPSSSLNSLASAPPKLLPKVSTLASADFNSDGSPDIVLSNQGLFGREGTNQISVYLNNGKGDFLIAPRSPITVSEGPQGLAVGDFNGDSAVDIAVSHRDGTLIVLLGNNTGQFAPAAQSPYRLSAPAWYVAAFDHNRDGIDDLAVTGNSGLLILSGRGDGTFSSGQAGGSNSNQSIVYGLRAGDFNGDGWADLATVNGAPLSTVTIFYNNRLNGFNQQTIGVAANPNSMTVGDFNADGTTDIATVGSGNQVVTTILMRTSGAVVAQVNPSLQGSAISLSIEPIDFDGDGNLDLLTGGFNLAQNRPFRLLLGDGRGGFKPSSMQWGLDLSVRNMAIGDFNGDGRQDVAFANDYFRDAGLYTLIAGGPSRLIPAPNSTPQSAVINSSFTHPLAVTLLDDAGMPVSGAPITFRFMPGSTTRPNIRQIGLTGVNANTVGITIPTDASGMVSQAIAANAVVGGPYSVTASTPGSADVVFSLTNLQAGAPVTMTLTSNLDTAFVGQFVLFRVNFSAPVSGGGTFTILDGNTVISSSPMPAEFRTGSSQVLLLQPGNRSITARYVLNSTSAAIQSPAINITVRANSANAPAISQPNGVVNGASLRGGFSSGTWLTIYGTNLSERTRIWQGSDFNGNNLPTQLEGVQVLLDGIPAYVYYVSPNQINFLSHKRSVPPLGRIQVLNANGVSNLVQTGLAPTAPAFFAYESAQDKYVIAQDAQSFELLGPPNLLGSGVTLVPARTGQLITLYATGLGETNPAYADGQLGESLNLASRPIVTLGGIAAEVSYAGRTGPGLYQLNVVVPQGLSGVVPITIRTATNLSPDGFFLSIGASQ